MPTSEYFLVFESIIFGLIVAQVLIGWNQMIALSGKYDFSWIQFFCTTAIFLAAIQNYYVGQITLLP